MYGWQTAIAGHVGREEEAIAGKQCYHRVCAVLSAGCLDCLHDQATAYVGTIGAAELGGRGNIGTLGVARSLLKRTN